VRLPASRIAGTGHVLVVGGSGSGKTRVAAGIAAQTLRWNVAKPSSVGIWVQDHKGDVVPLVRELLDDIAAAASRAEARYIEEHTVLINPFATDALVPFNVLALEPGVAPQVQAFEVAMLVTRMGGADVGPKQDEFIFVLVLLGIVHEPKPLTLIDLARLLDDQDELQAVARRSPLPEVRDFFAGKLRLAATSFDGVRARFRRLLRLPATRLMLGGERRLSFRRLLDEMLTFVDLGSPPLGCEDIGRFWSGLLTLMLTRAIFERDANDARRPVAILVDEWQEGLSAGGEVADQYERILAMARSRGCSLWLISQSLAGAAKVSSTLPKVVATNCNTQLLFRASPEDARAMSHVLPVTGRRPAPAPLPWEERSRQPFLSRSEEREALIAEVSALPSRTFYLWDRCGPPHATLVHAVEVAPRPKRFRPAGSVVRATGGALSVPIAELEASQRERERRLPREPTDIGTLATDRFGLRPRQRPRR